MDGDNADEQEQESPTKKSKTKSPGKKAGPFGPIPMSYEEIGPEDKLILRMKETEGKGWAEIQKALEDITGSKLGASTVRMRYTRMKANLVVFEKEDVSIPFLSFLLHFVFIRFPFIFFFLTSSGVYETDRTNRNRIFWREKRRSKRKWNTKNGRKSPITSSRKAETSTQCPRCKRSLRS